MAKRRGFTNVFKVPYEVVNLDKLGRFGSGARIDSQALKDAGLIHGDGTHVKVLGNGELTESIHLVGIKVSASARQKIEAAGGSVMAGEVETTAPVSEGDDGDTGSS